MLRKLILLVSACVGMLALFACSPASPTATVQPTLTPSATVSIKPSAMVVNTPTDVLTETPTEPPPTEVVYASPLFVLSYATW